jgi:hypothetical protein
MRDAIALLHGGETTLKAFRFQKNVQAVTVTRSPRITLVAC